MIGRQRIEKGILPWATGPLSSRISVALGEPVEPRQHLVELARAPGVPKAERVKGCDQQIRR